MNPTGQASGRSVKARSTLQRQVGTLLGAATAALITTLSANTEQVASERREFVVASVKPSTEESPGLLRALPDQFDARAIPLRTILLMALEIRPFQLIGAPSWVGDRYDIQAKTEGPVSPPQMIPMLRALLEERFGLKTRKERRDLPVYSLKLARPDGPAGPRLRRHTADCPALLRGLPATTPPTGPGEFVACGSFGGPTHFAAGDVSLSQIASGLSRFVDRPVIDNSGVEGTFDVHVTVAPFGPVAPAAERPETPASQDAPDIFTAVREQLGLRLEPSTAPIDVVVVEQITRPTPN